MKKSKPVNYSFLVLTVLFILSQTTFALTATLSGDESQSEAKQSNSLVTSALSSDSDIADNSLLLSTPSYDKSFKDAKAEFIEEIKFRKANEKETTIALQATILSATASAQQDTSKKENNEESTQTAAAAAAATPTPAAPTLTPTVKKIKGVVRYVNANKLNVRKEPSGESELVTSIKRGDKVTYYETIGEWARIITWTDKKGYVLAKYLVDSEKKVEKVVAATKTATAITSRGSETKAPAPAPQSAEGQSLAQKIVEYAKTLQGVKYVYGGYSKNGFDCSGFTKYVFSKFGIYLPRSSSEYWSFGTKISRSDIQIGDIVLFDTDGGTEDVSHVGIYIGDGNFIHASSSKGKVVIMSLNSYRGKYMGARRVIK